MSEKIYQEDIKARVRDVPAWWLAEQLIRYEQRIDKVSEYIDNNWGNLDERCLQLMLCGYDIGGD